jgi:hypothetical protein
MTVTPPVMHVIRMPSEGRRSADYERGSRRSKKQIFHDTVLSFDDVTAHICCLYRASSEADP